MPDTHAAARLQVPTVVSFWRQRFGVQTKLPLDSVHHRSPLFDDLLGSSPCRNLAVDELHTLHMGPVQRCASAALWRVVLSNPWGFTGSTDNVINRGVKAVAGDLRSWQRRPANQVAHSEQIQNLTRKMLGDRKGHLQDL